MENKELTIIDQVKNIEKRSGVAFEIDITEVASLAERARAITSVNDDNFLTIKRELQQKRKYVTEYFKDARDEFNKMSKGIIQVQNTILDEFTGEEDRLIALDKAEKERILMEERMAVLPARKERLVALGGEEVLPEEWMGDLDEYILEMADADFELYFAHCKTVKADTDRLAAEAKLAEERAAFEAEKAELARKQAEADRIEAARIEERELAAKELQLAKETAEREAKEAIERREREIKEAEERREAEEQERIFRAEREEKERKERIAQEAQEKVDAEIEAKRLAEEYEAKLAADEKWQAFLKKNEFNEETDIIIEGSKIYRLVATYE